MGCGCQDGLDGAELRAFFGDVSLRAIPFHESMGILQRLCRSAGGAIPSATPRETRRETPRETLGVRQLGHASIQTLGLERMATG